MKNDIGSKIRSLRKAAGMSQMKLADKIGVSYQQVQKYEKGISQLNTVSLQQVADAFRVPIDAFISDEVVDTSQALTSDMKEDEALVLTLYRRITRKKLRDSIILMTEDLVQLTESR